MPLSTGQVLNNRYRIVSQLAQGGFGTIYRAWDLSLKKACALKENLETSPDAHRQFEREASFLANLHHPNLPRVTDHFIIPGQGQYLVMDFVEGEDLQEMLDRQGPLPEPLVLGWVRQICEALQYLHGQNPPIIHRDIKPANIKIKPEKAGTDPGRVMLVDFGIAKLYDPAHGTTQGARAVTPGYSPQEQYGGGSTDFRSDVYALGATLYTLLTGQEPLESIQRALGIPMPAPRQLNPAISSNTERAIMKAMALSAVQRYQSVQELSAALQPQEQKISGVLKAAIGLGMTLLFVIAAGLGVLLSDALKPHPVPILTHFLDEEPSANPGADPAVRQTQTAMAQESGAFAQTATAALRKIQQTQPAVAHATVTPRPVLPEPSATPSEVLMATPRLTELGPGATKISPQDGMVMVYVPAGEFMMGASGDPDADEDEWPQHKVYLDAFWIDKTEVTNDMFDQFVAETGHITTAETKGISQVYDFSRGKWVLTEGATWHHPQGPGSSIKGRENHPVVHVSWSDAKAYCTWAGKRLPTEAEWEKAARGPGGRTYPWGEGANCNRAQYNDCGNQSLPVGSLPAGASYYGAEDMAGNVWEWTADWYGGNYYGHSPYNNPVGPSSGTDRVQRGGSWRLSEIYARSTNRANSDPNSSWESDGFRCAATP